MDLKKRKEYFLKFNFKNQFHIYSHLYYKNLKLFLVVKK